MTLDAETGRGTKRSGAARLDGLDRVMYIHRVVRTQLYLDETIHRRLRDMARRQGRTISDLVREAVSRAFGRAEDERAVTLQGIAGLWRDRSDLGDTREYVRRLRRGTRRARRLRA